MELVVQNGWNGQGWMLDRLTGFRRAVEEATEPHIPLRADVTEDKDAYHFYLEMPGLKAGSIDVQIEDDQLMVAAERGRPEWPQETRVHVAERQGNPIKRPAPDNLPQKITRRQTLTHDNSQEDGFASGSGHSVIPSSFKLRALLKSSSKFQNRAP